MIKIKNENYNMDSQNKYTRRVAICFVYCEKSILDTAQSREVCARRRRLYSVSRPTKDHVATSQGSLKCQESVLLFTRFNSCIFNRYVGICWPRVIGLKPFVGLRT